MENTETRTDPIFQIGQVPQIPHCDIQDMEYRSNGWYYFICNRYNSYASGWAHEDWIIKEIRNQNT